MGDPEPRDDVGTCEWCDLPATEALEIQHKLGKGTVRTGTFIYTCANHKATAEAVIADRASHK